MAVIRSIVAVLGGLLSGGIVIAIAEGAGHALLAGEAVFGVAAIGYGLGSATGTTAAAMIGDRKSAIAVPVLLALLAAFNLLSFRHPAWFAPAAAGALILGWWIGSKIVAHESNRSRTAKVRR